MAKTKSESKSEFPLSLKVGGQTITIEELSQKYMDDLGTFDSKRNHINLRNDMINEVISKNGLTISHTDLTVLGENLFGFLRNNDISFLVDNEN